LSDSNAVPVIVFAPARDTAEAVNATLRRAGHVVHCTWIPEPRELADALTQLNPELLLCHAGAARELTEAATIRNRFAPEVPLIALSTAVVEEAFIAEALAGGARDAVSLVRTDRLLAVVERELRAFRLERALNHTLQSARDYRRQLETVLQRSNDAIAEVQEGILVEANASWLELFAVPERTAVIGQPLMDLFEPSSHAALKGALVACLQGRWTDHVLRVEGRRADGTVLPMEFVLALGSHDGEPCVRLVVPVRRRDERGIADELADAVRRDSATGLLHRRPLLETIAARLQQPARAGVRYLAIVRPDKFSRVERDVGATASEQFLAELAAIVREQAASGDIAGRFSGNSYLLLLERGNERDVEAWGEQLVARVARHVFHVGPNTLKCTVTVGLGLVPHGAPDLDQAIADAIEACNRGRKQGGNQVNVVDRADQDTRVRAYDQVWVKHIRAALIENRFRLVQQPVASLRGDDPRMFDVLVRMLDHQGNEVLPSEFMPPAERNDLLRNIDRWVIGASLSFAAQRRPGCLFVRLSRDSLLDPAFCEWLDHQREASRAEAARVCFQITEALAEGHVSQAKMLGEALRGRGFRLALERFGGGRDSLGLLANVPLDFVKIDGALVQGLAGNFELQQSVRALVEAATRRRIETIAERVEDANAMAVLWQLGVQYIQGYFVHAPEEVVLHG
jgi:diguanylate cyclase (GGDEF)-like protein